MDIKPVALFCLCYSIGISADNKGDCILFYNQSTITADQWKYGLRLEDKLPDNAANGTIVATFQSSNIISTSSNSQYFTPVFDNSIGVLNIILSDPIDEVKDVVQSPINMKVNFQCNTDQAYIYISIAIEDINDHPPTFDNTSYSYNLPMPFPGGIDITSAFGEISSTDVDFTNTRVDFTLDQTGNKYFNVSLSRTEGKQYFATLKSKIRIDVTENIVFYITATDCGTPPLQNSVQVTIIPDSQYSTPTSPIFKDPVYISKVDEVNSAMKIPKSLILEDGYGTDVVVQLKDIQNGNWSTYFTPTISGNSVTVQLINQLPTDLLNYTNAVIIVEATRAGADHTGQTVLLITGPCSASTPDYPPATCPGVSLHFTQDEYYVVVKKNQSGMLIEFKVITNHTDEVEFGIVSDDENITKIFKIGPQDGILYADEPLLSPLEFEFNVTAKINSTQEHATAKVTVKLVNSTTGIQNPEFTKSLEIYHITEETIGGQIIPDIIFPSPPNSSCVFKIKSQHPSGDFFSLSETTGVVNIINKIDREADIFANMTQAAITLNLQIVCTSVFPTGQQEFSSDGEVENLPNDPLQTTLIVYVDDTNDNAPYFGLSKVTVGYPVEELAVRLQPKSFATVKATDKDLGVNSEIKYSLISDVSDQVMIHPQSGSVYPLEGFKFQDITFSILAEDQNGIKGCKNTTMEFEIKILSPEDVTILYIEDAVIEDLPDILAKLRSGSEYDIQVTDSAIISAYTQGLVKASAMHMKLEEQNTNNATTKSLLRLIVYAMDKNGQVVSEEMLLKDLADVSIVKTASSATALIHSTEVKQDNTVFIAIIIVLISILVIVLLSVTVSFYLVYVRPRRVNGFTYTTEFGSKERINNNMEPVAQTISPMDTSESDVQVSSTSDSANSVSTATPPVITLTETSQSSVPPAPPAPSAPPASIAPASQVDDKKSPRERKRSQPVRGDLIPDPDKLLSYRKHKPKDDEDLPDPTVPGGGAPMPREPRQPGGEPIERKRSTVRFSPVIESIDK